MAIKTSEYIPFWCKGTLSINYNWSEYLKVKFKKATKWNIKIFEFILKNMKDDLKNTKDDEIKKLKEESWLEFFIESVEKFLSDEDIEKILEDFSFSLA